MPPSIATALAEALADDWRSKARPSQLPPDGDWNIWLMRMGRGAGKTWAGANWTNELASYGEAGRIALIGATAADTRDVMIEGPSGILATAPNWCRPIYESSKRRLTWPNGAVAHAFSADEPDRLRGPQFDFGWCDELAAWSYGADTWAMFALGLRLGAHPRAVITTTPRPTKLIRELLARPDVVQTTDSTFANAANLAPAFLASVRARYEGTRLGRQELEAELLTDTPGALWQLEWLDRDRVTAAPAELKRIVVAIDPAGSSAEGADETGIVVAGIGGNGHAYVLEDLSGRYAPHEWARRAIDAYRRHKADRIIAEQNFGGEMVAATLRSIDRSVSFKSVHASRGKIIRAEPIAALYEQAKVHHCGTFAALEDQLCAFAPDFDRSRDGSPDRLDALVWALTELMLVRSAPVAQFGFYRCN
jgi:phage terminase large subunit-like protein